MSYDAILQVSRAEESARASLLEAQDQARERIAAAQSAAEQRLAGVKKQLSAETAEALAEERKKDEAYAAGQAALSEQDCGRLREQAAAHMDAAVARVMERVMG